MLSIVACGVCGADPATDTMLIQAALAGVLSVPWFFRNKLAATARRIRGEAPGDEESCPIAPDEGD